MRISTRQFGTPRVGRSREHTHVRMLRVYALTYARAYTMFFQLERVEDTEFPTYCAT